MNILNLYCGIGGNRKMWGDDHEITAVEFDPKIAAIYQDFFPNDTVVVADAHQYLLEHYREFDFIWASPPCPTHSGVNNFLNPQGIIRYPDMKLWQEIIFLQHFCKTLFCIENVKSYYEPFLKPQISGRHYFWSNLKIPQMRIKATVGKMCGKEQNKNRKDIQISHGMRAQRNAPNNLNIKVLNNCCHPEIGLAILNSALGIITENSVKAGQLF